MITRACSSSEAINRAWSFSETIILLLDASFLQSSHSATHPVWITLQCGVPHPHDFLDLDLDFDLKHCLSAICRKSSFHSRWLGQSVVPHPYAMIGRASCVLLPHARHFSPLLHLCGCGLQAVEASIKHLRAWWLAPLPFPQNRESPAHLFWYTSCTIRTFADIRKCE